MLTIKSNDTKNGIHAIIKSDGKPVDLTGLSVEISISNGVRSRVQVLDAKNGEVFYPLEGSAVAKSGYYNYEFKVIYEDKRIETFPNEGYLKLRIHDDIGGI